MRGDSDRSAGPLQRGPPPSPSQSRRRSTAYSVSPLPGAPGARRGPHTLTGSWPCRPPHTPERPRAEGPHSEELLVGIEPVALS
jgi:hypothetical protein